MTVTMTIATLYMVGFWMFSTFAILMAKEQRFGWMKFFIALSASCFFISMIEQPLTLVDALCGLTIFGLLAVLVIFIGAKFGAEVQEVN